MTRFINKDEKTQVNSNLIGVRVIPRVVPPTYEVMELTANVQVKRYLTEIPYNGKPMLYATYGGSDMIWGYTDSDEEYGDTVYNVWSCIMGSSQYDTLLTKADEEITSDTHFYVHTDDPYAPDPVFPADFDPGYSLDMNGFSGYLYEFDPNNGILCDLDSEDTYALVDGFIMNNNTGLYAGKIVSDSLDNEEYTGRYRGENGEYTAWGFELGNGIELYSTVRNPAVGDNLRSNTNSETVYLSPVLSVTQEEVDPGHTEDVDCSVSYSVDGKTWTDWTENLTDDNNVIANVPRYMYLKFGQDVEITEE